MAELIRTYSRAELRPGLTYPLGQTQIVQVLRDCGAVVDGLGLHCPARGVRRTFESGPLVRARWSSRIKKTWLEVYAVPSHLRTPVAELLLGGTLQQACLWIKSAAERPDSAWAGTDHQWQAWMRDGLVEVTET
ncbi:hypothetical protein [Catellatospora sp. TT07R-123]|uniref:hypothetical protein n=1 Tax=Catellatospora sp. TT07R-123 TaxID=2733863 RepID=UPI001BB33F3B|nr:hypothetical protein [Catellatospora sp. TT07R-123]